MAYKRVFLESPFSGDRDLNDRYLLACMADSHRRGETFYASHGAGLTRILNDADPVQRAEGIKAGQAWREVCAATVVYVDLGISSGMQKGIDHAKEIGHPVEERRVSGWTRELSDKEALTETRNLRPRNELRAAIAAEEVSEYPTIDQNEATIHRLSVSAFARHAIKPEGPPDGVVRSWICRRPQYSEHWFRVIAGPGLLVVTGDLGECVLTFHDRNALAWLRGSWRSRDYFFEKVSPHCERERFYPAEAERFLVELDAERPEWATKIRAEWSLGSSSDDPLGHDFRRACRDAGVDEIPGSVDGPTEPFSGCVRRWLGL